MSFAGKTLIRRLIILITCLASLHYIKTQECHSSSASTIKLSLHSRRNSTGHRNMKVFLQSRAASAGETDVTAVDAFQTVSLCDGIHIFSSTATVSALPAIVRLPGYELYPGLGYYKMHIRAVNWDEAVRSCMQEGAILMTPGTEAEAGVLKHLMARKYTVEGATWANWVYAGFHDRGTEGDYLTLEGKRINESGYKKWISGQPDNKPWGTEGDQDCGGINSDGLMQDLPCLAKIPFICKQPL